MAMFGAVGSVSMMGWESGVIVYMQLSSILTSGTTPGNRFLQFYKIIKTQLRESGSFSFIKSLNHNSGKPAPSVL
jgi:hypothetical protein